MSEIPMTPQPEPEARRRAPEAAPPWLTNTVAIGSLVTAVFLLVLMAVFVYIVIDHLVQPSPLFTAFVDRIAAEKLEQKGGLQTTAQAAIILEYANADIRTAGFQIAFALVGGFFFVIVGLLLFAAGFSGALTMEASGHGTSFKAITSAPGVAAIVIGGVIVCAGVLKDVSRPLEARILEAIDLKLSEQEQPPPRSGRGEPPSRGSAHEGEDEGIPSSEEVGPT